MDVLMIIGMEILRPVDLTSWIVYNTILLEYNVYTQKTLIRFKFWGQQILIIPSELWVPLPLLSSLQAVIKVWTHLFPCSNCHWGTTVFNVVKWLTTF